MRKILIISYFFPPCNLTASQRALGWARYLNKFGYYPVVITRSWDMAIVKPEDGFVESGKTVVIDKQDNYEVHYLPYKPSLRDRLFVLPNKNAFTRLIQKTLTFAELISYGFTSSFIAYKNIYSYCCNYISSNKDVKAIVVTANPFVMFKFGYLINKKFGIKWVADYRDDWSTSELSKANSFPERIIAFFDKKNEKKWVGSAAVITSISPYYVSKISRFVKVPGALVLNGFLREATEQSNHQQSTTFTIVYNGTLYSSQPVDKVLKGFADFIHSVKSPQHIKLLFAGAGFDPVQKHRIIGIANELGILSYVEITDRMPKEAIIRIQQSAHVLLMIAHEKIKGIPSSKLYEYLSLEKPILAFPGDDDIVDETLALYNLGRICNTTEGFIAELTKFYSSFLHNKYDELIADKAYVELFSREHQAKKLAVILDGLEIEDVRH